MITKKLQIVLYIFLFVSLVFLGFFILYNTLDPDFGWHIKTGQLILEKGVPYQDWYSYTMPDFPWVDHEWLTDVLMYKIYSYFGLHFLLLIFLSIYVASFFIIKKPRHSIWNFCILTILAYLSTVAFLGVRPQLLTVLFIAILLKAIDMILEGSSKIIYFTPLLFILWVNLHASFFAGLIILLVIILLEIFKKTKIWKKIKVLNFINTFNLKEQTWSKIFQLSLILVVSFLATTLNPYGLRIYEEVFRTTGDNFLRFHIVEWVPLFFSGFKPFLYLYLGIFISFLILFYRKIELNHIILSALFLFLSILSVRYALVFVIISLPMLLDTSSYVKNINFLQSYKFLSNFERWIFTTFFIFLLITFGYSLYKLTANNLKEEFYPREAITFLKTLPLSENLFNDYDWGGYLIWKLPERKYFIDGRMPSWREGEQFVFGDYVKIIKAESGFDKILEKYDVKLILIKKSLEDRFELKNNHIKEFFKNHYWLSSILGIPTNNDLYDELTKLGWQTIYQDNVSVILEFKVLY